MGFETIYPNLYVILIGPSGAARKGVALGIAKDMLATVPIVSIAPESTSGREAIILAMKRALSTVKDPVDGKVKFHCSLTAFSEELSVFLGQGDTKLLAAFTDWYDAKPDWAYETISRGMDSLQGLCFNLLGATAPDWIQSMLPHEAIGGGFTARVIFVVESRKGKTVPEHDLTEDEQQLARALRNDLEKISQLTGKFTFERNARDEYNAWYTEQDRLMNAGKPAVDDPRFSAYCQRRATHVRKVMMLMSASRGQDLCINTDDFRRARSVLEGAERNMGSTFGGLGTARYSDSTEKIKDYIQSVGVTSRSVLLAKFYRDVDSFALKQIEEVLQQMGVIKIESTIAKGEKIYRWESKSNEDVDKST